MAAPPTMSTAISAISAVKNFLPIVHVLFTTPSSSPRLRGRRRRPAGAPHQLAGQRAERQHRVSESGVGDAPRHFPHHAGGLVLHDDAATRPIDFFAALPSVLAHA